MRETRDLQDNQLTNPKTQTPSKKKKTKQNKKEEKIPTQNTLECPIFGRDEDHLEETPNPKIQPTQ